MRVSLFIAVLLALIMVNGCETSEDATFKSAIVVQGYLYANEPFDTITLRQSLPLDVPEEDSYLSGAIVTLTDDQNSYQLSELDPHKLPGRYGAPFTIMVKPGVTYTLHIEALGQVVTAQTTVPDIIKLDSVRLNHGTLSLSAVDTVLFPEDDSKLTNPGVELFWTPSKTASSYGIEAISLDTTADKIGLRINFNLPDTSSIGRYRFFIISQHEQVAWVQFRRFGLNAVRALAIDKNYQDFIFGLFLSGTQINNGTLHINGGLGVFASAARVTKLLYVKEQT